MHLHAVRSRAKTGKNCLILESGEGKTTKGHKEPRNGRIVCVLGVTSWIILHTLLALQQRLPGRLDLPTGVFKRIAVVDHHIGLGHFSGLRRLRSDPRARFVLAHAAGGNEPRQLLLGQARDHPDRIADLLPAALKQLDRVDNCDWGLAIGDWGLGISYIRIPSP